MEAEIRAAHRRTRETYGPERLQKDLAEHGVQVGLHRIGRLSKKLGLRCKQNGKFKATTDSKHNLPFVPNLLEQYFTAEASYQSEQAIRRSLRPMKAGYTWPGSRTCTPSKSSAMQRARV